MGRIKKIPLTVTIIAKDEEDRIGWTLESVKDLADEVIVVDSGSTDKTVTIAEKYGAKVLFNEWQGYGQQKIFAEKQAKNDWILNLDADESLTEELKQEIAQEILSNPDPRNTYLIRWKILFWNEKKVPRFAYSDSFVRLYNKQVTGFSESTVHDSVKTEGTKIESLKGYVIHRCYKSYEHWAAKINNYTSMQADDIIRKKRKISGLRVFSEPFVAFFKSYFLRRYFVYGLDGFIYSFIYAYSKLLRLVKVRESYQVKTD